MAEGYTEAEMEKFLGDVKRSADYIFSEEPFQSHRDEFNIRAVKSASKDSGTDIPGEGIWKNTVINSSFYTFGIERYMTTMDFKSVCDVAANAHYDQIYILVNTDKYGGGGIYNHYSISAADNEASRAVVIHEFGHAFGGLADEYYYFGSGLQRLFSPGGGALEPQPDYPGRFSFQMEGDTWWRRDRYPTPAEDRYQTEVGVYEGGGYVAKGVYRPMIDCRMHTNDAVFCPVCSNALIKNDGCITRKVEQFFFIERGEEALIFIFVVQQFASPCSEKAIGRGNISRTQETGQSCSAVYL